MDYDWRGSRLRAWSRLGIPVLLLLLGALMSGWIAWREAERARSNKILVLMLTARGQEMDKVRGLKLGADDYVTKPFSVMELMARVAALLRRAPDTAAPDRLEAVDVVVDFRAREAWQGGRSVALTEREFEILELLASRRGEAVSRADLVARIWGIADDVEVSTRTVDQHVAAIRRKLADNSASPRLIQTVYGRGYRLAR